MAEAAWPGFRGHGRSGVLHGVRIETDWSRMPPVELWRRPIGPGVSSFAATRELLYTQEQRGDEELVVAYKLDTGEPVWKHSDPGRFYDSHVGAGPRATPTLHDGRVYAFGASGILNVLDAGTGALLWSRNSAEDTGSEVHYFGFVSSPLIAHDLVLVHTDRLIAYERTSGEPRWMGPAVRGESYSSPHLLTIDGSEQIVVLNKGVMSFAPENGELLWKHDWPGIGIVQPTLTTDGDLLFSMIDGGASPIGTRRLNIVEHGDEWKVEEKWTSIRLKPSFSPIVVHEGYAYGVDGRILACIDVEQGERQWKGGRFGSGQVLLLPDQDLLLVVSEHGQVALVRATPEKFEELARFDAIEGKTWNQPALIDDVLLLRNGQEMAAFRLASPST